MNENRLNELIYQEVDGTNTPEEHDELARHLTGNDEARYMLAEARRLSTVLSAVHPVEPPRSLKQMILNSLPAGKNEMEPSKGIRILLRRLQNLLGGRRIVYGFAGGLAVGIIVILLLQHSPQSANLANQDVYGAIALNAPLDAFSEDERVPIQTDRVSGELKVLSAGEILLAELDLSAGTEIEVHFAYHSSDVSFGGLRPLHDAQSAYRLGKGFFTLSHSGSNQYLVAFRKSSSADRTPIQIQLRSGGNPVFNHEMMIP